MAIYDGVCPEAQVPVGCAFGAAPLGELWILEDPRWLAGEWKVTDQHGWNAWWQCCQPSLGLLDACVAPRVDARIRVRVQHGLVGAHDACLVRQSEGFRLGGGTFWAERVVVQHEQRCDYYRPALAAPYRERVLRGDHANPAAHRNQELIPGRTAQLHRVRAERPEFMVAGRPDDACEAGP
jgi:hypothetical protein